MIKIYGSPRTSAGRCFLMLEEIGQPYTPVALDMFEKREHKSADYLRLNPNGKVPCLVDGDVVLWESAAINFYLAEKYKPELLGQSAYDKALVWQWSLWSQLELQPPLIDIFIELNFVPEAKRDALVIQKSKEKIPPVLTILDHALTGKEYLVAGRFSVADVNMASVVNIASALGFSLSEHKNLTAWMEKIRARPAFQKIMQLRGAR